MAIKDNIVNIRAFVKSYEAAREALNTEIAHIEANTTFSFEHKEALKQAAQDKAKASLKLGLKQVDGDIVKLEERASQNTAAFDYSNPKLISAVTFINASGKNLPVIAAEQMVRDFSSRPAELKYLSDVFKSYGLVSASMSATEAAKEASMSVTLPQRISDMLYYSIDAAGPLKEKPFTGLLAELDAYDSAFIDRSAE